MLYETLEHTAAETVFGHDSAAGARFNILELPDDRRIRKMGEHFDDLLQHKVPKGRPVQLSGALAETRDQSLTFPYPQFVDNLLDHNLDHLATSLLGGRQPQGMGQDPRQKLVVLLATSLKLVDELLAHGIALDEVLWITALEPRSELPIIAAALVELDFCGTCTTCGARAVRVANICWSRPHRTDYFLIGATCCACDVQHGAPAGLLVLAAMSRPAAAVSALTCPLFFCRLRNHMLHRMFRAHRHDGASATFDSKLES